MNLVACAVVSVGALVATSIAANSGPIDPRTVQAVTIYELNVDAALCPSILIKNGTALCPNAARHYVLKQTERDRILSLLNEHSSWDASKRPTCSVPREAVVVETTKGTRAFDINLECDNVAGRAPTKATKKALSLFMRGFGFVAHVPFNLD